jgi:hypothetical protein
MVSIRRNWLFDSLIETGNDLWPSILTLRTMLVALLDGFAINRFLRRVHTNKAKSNICLRDHKAPLASSR